MTCYGKALPLPLLVDKCLLCSPSYTVLQLFTPRDDFLSCGLQHSVSALRIDDHHSATSSPDAIINIVSIFFSGNLTPKEFIFCPALVNILHRNRTDMRTQVGQLKWKAILNLMFCWPCILVHQ
jgi:hypothetical protein